MNFLDLNREYELFDWKEAIDSVFLHKKFIDGPEVKELENEIAKLVQTKHAIGVSSGTDALMVSLMGIDKKAPTVLTTPYTFISTVEVPMRLGCKVVLCDIGTDFNIDIDKAKEILDSKEIDVFIPVHLFGLPCSIDDEIIEICRRKGILIIEDAAQSIGSFFNGKPVGSLGDVACFSFFPSKNLGGIGDGGLITTNDSVMNDSFRMIKNHGCSSKYLHEMFGGNFRLDTIQASVLLKKLGILNDLILSRQNTADIYDKYFKDIPEIRTPKKQAGRTYNQYVIRVDSNKRDLIRSSLMNKGVPTAIYYPKSLEDQPIFKDIDFGDKYPQSQISAKENISLPIANLLDIEREIIVNSLIETVKSV